MGMSTDKKLRWTRNNLRLYLWSVASGIASDMGHPHINTFTDKPVMFRTSHADIPTIDIPPHTPKRLKSCQCIDNRNGTEVARMPNFIALIKIPKNRIVQIPMRIRKESYFHHLLVKYST